MTPGHTNTFSTQIAPHLGQIICNANTHASVKLPNASLEEMSPVMICIHNK